MNEEVMELVWYFGGDFFCVCEFSLPDWQWVLLNSLLCLVLPWTDRQLGESCHLFDMCQWQTIQNWLSSHLGLSTRCLLLSFLLPSFSAIIQPRKTKLNAIPLDKQKDEKMEASIVSMRNATWESIVLPIPLVVRSSAIMEAHAAMRACGNGLPDCYHPLLIFYLVFPINRSSHVGIYAFTQRDYPNKAACN